MKYTLMLLLLLSANLYTQDFFPKTNVPTDMLGDFNISTSPSTRSNNLYHESNVTDEINITSEAVNIVRDSYGSSGLDNNVSAVNMRTLMGYSEASKGSYGARGNTLVNTYKKNFDGMNTNDLNSLSREYILSDVNSSEGRAADTSRRFFEKARSLVANLKSISCYATRELVNSYYCPLPGMENSFFKGGSKLDLKEQAKKECEDLCQTPSSCLYKEMGKDDKVDVPNSFEKLDGEKTVEISVDNAMLPDYVSFDFHNTYQYDENITVGSNEYNETKAAQEIEKLGIRVKVDVYQKDHFGNYEKVMENFGVNVKEQASSFKIHFSQRTSGVKFHFYKPYLVNADGNYTDVPQEFEMTLDDTTLKYTDNKWYFCPEIHFNNNAADCDGEIKLLTIGATTYNVCVTDSRKKIEPMYGAFYQESTCNSACVIKRDCVPTYKHLANIDVFNLPESLKDIDIDCTGEASNTSCTKQKCIDLFIEDTMPYTEKSWTNDDEVKLTVSSGIPSSEHVRPRIDVEGGLSANGDENARKATSIREMSEISYHNMIEAGNYDISTYSISENIPKKYSHEIINGISGKALVWNLKPSSRDVISGQQYYFYSIIEIGSSFMPNTPYNNNENGQSDMRLDKTYLLKTTTGYKIIRKKLNSAIYLDYNQTDFDAVIHTGKSWVDTPTDEVDTIGVFNGVGFSLYDPNTTAEHFDVKEFSLLKNYESFLIYENPESVVSTPGVLFMSQNTEGQNGDFIRVYGGTKDLLYASSLSSITVYGLYSSSQLSYQEVMDQTINLQDNSNAVFSTKFKLPAGAVVSDGEFNNPKVQMYINGEMQNMSVNVDFTPNVNEEGKKTFIYMLLFDETAGEN